MSSRKKILKRRKSRWNDEYRLPIVQAAVCLYRKGGLNTVQIERKFGIPPRTLKRYVTLSKDPEGPIYLKETIYEYENRCNISILVDSSKSIINELLNSDQVDKFDDIYESENSDDLMLV
jgi:hypothetical protein